jgi:uncharacterized protein with von Willebrand factor type A (vWA) domain
MVTDLAELVGRFGDRLHAAGVPVTPAMSGRFAAAVVAAAPQRTPELYWLARVTLVIDRSHLDTFRRVFDEVFGGLVDATDADRNPDAPRPPVRARPTRSGDRAPRRPPSAGGDDDGSGADSDGTEERPFAVAAASAEERLRHRTFDQCTVEELEQLAALMDELLRDPPLRRSRRTRVGRRGADLDLRATLRAARRTAGDPVRTVHRRRRQRVRKVVLIADVSGSMEAYGRAYLYLLHGAVRSLGAEAFVCATRLHRLTRQLRATRPAIALAAAMEAAPDWSGGTRLGAAIKEFNDGWARRGIGRGAVVVIVSDGWEGDDPALLGQQVERLGRLVHRIVWINPRRQSARYQPLVGGMAAALPHVDAFVSGHDFAALRDVVAAISD